jgi:thymidylate synthase
MRAFRNFIEAKNEITRDLNELGISVFAGYQSQEVSEENMAKLTTKELRDYDYIVLQPNPLDLQPTQPWADVEWAERLMGINGKPVNPGVAWESRPDVWAPLLENRIIGGKSEPCFSYTYSQRFAYNDIPHMIAEMERHPTSRQIYISIWHPMVDSSRLGKRRVPCSLGYQIMYRNGKIDIAYHMRSSDFATHFDNDIWMALKLQQYFATSLNRPLGTFTHKIGSLHVYASEVAHAF